MAKRFQNTLVIIIFLVLVVISLSATNMPAGLAEIALGKVSAATIQDISFIEGIREKLVVGNRVLFPLNQSHQRVDLVAGDVNPVQGSGDVSITDPYYDALRNVTDRYGINVINSDGKFRGNQSLTRAEFVVYLNDSLRQITQIPASGDGNVSLLTNDLERISAELANESLSIDEELARIKTRLNELERNVSR